MKQSPISPTDIAASVWAVPPLALDDAGAIRDADNAALVRHIEAGGVTTLLYGGNANLYGATQALFEALIDALPGWAGAETWVIPSVGPDYGKLMDQGRVLAGTAFPAAMALPMAGPRDQAGTERALRDFAGKAGMPVIIYTRSADYLPAERLGALIEDGTAVAVKYAVEPQDLTVDPYLTEILDNVPSERIVSGIGEIAALSHLSAFPMAGFTAGAVCIAPRRAMTVLRALQARRFDEARALTTAIEPLEHLRQAHGPIPVIHEAVTQSGIADMGAIRPHFSPVSEAVCAEIRIAVRALLDAEAELAVTEAA